jgi:hypothetical protein
MASTYLEKTFSSAGNRKKWTWSGWVKRCNTGVSDGLFGCAGSTNQVNINIESSTDGVDFWVYSSGAYAGRKTTNRKLRDCNGFYHIVCSFDSANATAGDRMKIYINGERQTSFSTSTNPSQNLDGELNNSVAHQIGANGNNNNDFNGILSHVHFCDGYAYEASDFGETDSTTGQWKIKTNPSVSYGTNGFFLFKDNNSADDQSGNNNDFTITGTLTQTEDCPSNVFATWNALQPTGATLSNGNTTGQSTNGNYISGVSTLGVTTGKYYAEFKLSAESATGESTVGVTGLVRPTSAIISQTGNFGLRNSNGITYYTSGGTASTSTSQHSGFTTSDIIGVALDLDNDRLYFSKNGGWWNGTSTWTGTSPTNYITLQTDIFDEFFFECGDAGASVNATWQANFGNGYFGTTAITSEGTNASGIGKFEYDVPTGYTALSTKGLNE